MKLPNLSSGLYFNLLYTSESVRLAVAAVPEPKTLVLAAVALAPYVRRTKRRESAP
jgi:hypothetical protein